MAVIVKVDELQERYVQYFRKALDTSDHAVFLVHTRIVRDPEFYMQVWQELSWKERCMIRDTICSEREERPAMLPNGRSGRFS